MSLIKVNTTEEGYFATFPNGQELEITGLEYNNSHEYIKAERRMKYDTLNGNLQDNQYADIDDNLCLVKLEDCLPCIVSKTKIVNNVLDTIVSEEINNCNGATTNIWL